jgi:hypothetical protein
MLHAASCQPGILHALPAGPCTCHKRGATEPAINCGSGVSVLHPAHNLLQVAWTPLLSG